MTYKELYESAIDKLEKSKITPGEFEKVIEPLNAEIATADSDTISRAKAIDGKICIRRSNGVEIYDDYVVPVEYLEQLPPAQPEHYTDALKAEIKRMKRSFTICINSDYYTGYMSALSAVEGYIAQMEVTT